MVEQIDNAIDIAKNNCREQMKRYQNLREHISVEKYRELFLHTAKFIMYERKNFDEFMIDEFNTPIINEFYNYTVHQSACFNSYIGIILNGKYGCGKSVLIEAFCRILNLITYSEKNKIQFFHSIELADLIINNGVSPYAKMPLCIQDLGKEKKGVNHFGTIYNPISELLAVRAEYGSLTFGSTNMDIPTLSQFYQEYVGKRLLEHVNIVFLPGNSRRKDYSVNQPVSKNG
jgi:DNA replication protein DnaC